MAGTSHPNNPNKPTPLLSLPQAEMYLPLCRAHSSFCPKFPLHFVLTNIKVFLYFPLKLFIDSVADVPSHLQRRLPSRGIQAFRLKMKTGFRELELLGFPDRTALKWQDSLFAVLLLVAQCSRQESSLLLHSSGVVMVQLYGILSCASLGVSFFERD